MINPTDLVRGQKTRKEVEREEKKAELGVCRIRKLPKDGKGYCTFGSASVIRNLLIDWPGYKNKYCLVTTDRVLPDEDFDVKDFVLDFRKSSSILKKFYLDEYANNKAVFQFTSGLVVIPLEPKKKYQPVKKSSIFTFRPFTRESDSSGKLFCPIVEDTGAERFTVRKDFALKHLEDQLGSKYVLYDEHSSGSFSTLTEFIGTSNRKPHGAVILSDKTCKAVGVLYCSHDQPSRISPIWLSQENLKPSSVGSPKLVVEQPLEKSLEAAEPHSNKRPPRNKEVEVSETDKEDATTAQSKKCPKKSRNISESSSDPEPSSVGSPKVVVEQSLEKSLEAAEPHSNKRPPRNKEVGVSETDKEDATTAQSKKCPKKSGSISESSSDPGHKGKRTAGSGLEELSHDPPPRKCPGFANYSIKEGTPSDDELEDLSQRIAEAWKPLGRRLKIEEARLTAFHKENEGYSEKAYKMLLYWKDRDGTDATYLVLYTALRDKLVQKKRLAEELCCD